MSDERECTNFASAEDVLVWLSGFGGGPNQPSVEKVRDAIKFARAAIADEREVRQWAERQRDVAERGLADAHDVLATLRTERDEARAQLDALREAAERFLVDDANGVTETAGLVAALADTPGAARDRAAADARAVERIRSRAEVEGDHCYPGQPAREAAWADRALESEARQAERERRAAVVGFCCAVNRGGGIAAESAILANADVMGEIDEMLANARQYDGEPSITERERASARAVHDAVALTNAEEERTRMDRHALVLAYEWLRSSSGRFTRESYKKSLESDSVYRVEMAMDALALGLSFCDGLRDVLTDRRGYVLRPARRTRARLALAIRAILRADRGDCGRARCSGCRCVTRNNAAIVRGWCSCCEERAEWRRDRITPLWERARRSV